MASEPQITCLLFMGDPLTHSPVRELPERTPSRRMRQGRTRGDAHARWAVFVPPAGSKGPFTLRGAGETIARCGSSGFSRQLPGGPNAGNLSSIFPTDADGLTLRCESLRPAWPARRQLAVRLRAGLRRLRQLWATGPTVR